MIDTYNIRFYKNTGRVAPARLDAADARLFYRQLQLLMKTYESRYGQNLSDESILVMVDDRPIYRKRSGLNTKGVETIQDMMEYLELSTEPKLILANNCIVTNKELKLSDIYVLRFYTH